MSDEFKQFTIFGYKVHLVVEDDNGAFEVLQPFRLTPTNEVVVNQNNLLEAVNERNRAARLPLQRAVTFSV